MKFIKKIKNPILREAVDWTFHIGIAVIIAVIIINYVFQRTLVNKISMTPTLQEGDNLFIEKVSMRLGMLKRGDIITFYSEKRKELLIKRIIGVADDTVKIQDGQVHVNGSIIKENYIKGNYTKSRGDYLDVKVPKGYVYVLGDNRIDDIIDSREDGPISVKDIEGKAFVRLWPINKIRFF